MRNNLEYFKTHNFFKYFLLLIPLFLITGPFLSDLSISILAICSFIFIKEKKYYFNLFSFSFFIFWFCILLSSALSENKVLSLESSLFYFRFYFFSIFFWYLIEKDKNILENLFKVLFFSFSILIIDSFYQSLNGINLFNMELVEKNRVSSFFGDELKMGGYFMRLFPIFISLIFLFYEKKKYQKFLSIFFLFILLIQITIYLSGERTSFILFNFTIFLFIIFLNDLKFLKIIFTVFYILSFILLINLDTPYKKRLIDLTLNQTNIVSNQSNKFIFSKQYQEHYLSAWSMFKDHKVTGIGPKNFRVKCKDAKYNYSNLTCSTHPHNFAIQLLSETGILGFSVYFILNIILWYSLIKSLFVRLIKKIKIFDNFQISLLIGTAILIWPLAPNGNFFNNWLSILLYFSAGISLYAFKKHLKIPKKLTNIKKFII